MLGRPISGGRLQPGGAMRAFHRVCLIRLLFFPFHPPASSAAGNFHPERSTDVRASKKRFAFKFSALFSVTTRKCSHHYDVFPPRSEPPKRCVILIFSFFASETDRSSRAMRSFAMVHADLFLRLNRAACFCEKKWSARSRALLNQPADLSP